MVVFVVVKRQKLQLQTINEHNSDKRQAKLLYQSPTALDAFRPIPASSGIAIAGVSRRWDWYFMHKM